MTKRSDDRFASKPRVCARKKRYATRKQALTAVFGEYAAGRDDNDLSAYKCAHCRGWHLTSHPKGRAGESTPDPQRRVG